MPLLRQPHQDPVRHLSRCRNLFLLPTSVMPTPSALYDLYLPPSHAVIEPPFQLMTPTPPPAPSSPKKLSMRHIPLIYEITRGRISCRIGQYVLSLLPAYSRKRLLVKVFKAPSWDGTLKEYIQRFNDRKSEFNFAISIHTGIGIDNANVKLDVLLTKPMLARTSNSSHTEE